MTKRELIEELEKLDCPDDAEVFVYGTGTVEVVDYDSSYNEVAINDRY